jgi:uracil-DNA glycosylase family 4
MRWTERQRAMLREMGVQLWSREDAGGAVLAPSADRSETPAPRSSPAPSSSPPASASLQRPTPAPTRAPSLAAADWLVVGEAFDPADPQQEQLLDNMLRAIGVARVASTRERRATFIALDAGASANAPAAAPGAAEVLAASIDAVAPRCIVALGRAAAAALLGSDAPLGNWRGRCHERATLPVVVTFSLPFLLRHPADKAKAWADLCLAVAAAAAPAA